MAWAYQKKTSKKLTLAQSGKHVFSEAVQVQVAPHVRRVANRL
jgi:hypothetical protein